MSCSIPTTIERPAPVPVFEKDGITLYHGDCLTILPHLPAESFDALITDPPYSSGGLTTAERQRDPVAKYCQSGNACGRPTFSGDNRDQRSFRMWCVLWLSECRRLLKTGGYCLVFSDWRQLPTMTDAVQAAGFVWRGIIAWDKGGASRAPHKGYVRHQCEYVIWGTNGPCSKRDDAGPFPGCYHVPHDLADKHHITGKPVRLMQQLVQIVPPGGRILDPFAGSGTTGVAAVLTKRRGTLVDDNHHYCEITRTRLLVGQRFEQPDGSVDKVGPPNPPQCL